ncbi:MAG: SDR family NAD(P)-dependent oxidoreductase, partial [Oscillospiraceae bacterium]|nr:SDR family NAD(P)-dependent oxidoreductase [Oscillospiraceae bacterium]
YNYFKTGKETTSMKNYFDLSGQTAVITGCSTGLGVQMAKALANQGSNIVCLARRRKKWMRTRRCSSRNLA